MSYSYTIDEFKKRKTYWPRRKIFCGLKEEDKIKILDEGCIPKKELHSFIVFLEDKNEIFRRLMELYNDPDPELSRKKIDYFDLIPFEDEKIKLLEKIEKRKKIAYICKLKNPEEFCIEFNEYIKECTTKQKEKARAKLFGGIRRFNYEDKLKVLSNIDLYNYELPSNLLSFIINPSAFLENINEEMLEKIKNRFTNYNDIKFRVDGLSGYYRISFDEVYESLKNKKFPVESMIIDFWDINKININIMKSLRKKFKNNYRNMKFRLRGSEVEEITYSFDEFFEIIEKIEELTSDIPDNIDEPLKFYIIYRRIIENILYDDEYIEKKKKLIEQMSENTSEEYWKELKPLRRYCAGLYGGLVQRKAICAGYATILYFALQKVGIKSYIITGDHKNNNSINKHDKIIGHAWNKVVLNGKYYNADPTNDAYTFHMGLGIQKMLRANRNFDNYSVFTNISGHNHAIDDGDDYPVESLIEGWKEYVGRY